MESYIEIVSFLLDFEFHYYAWESASSVGLFKYDCTLPFLSSRWLFAKEAACEFYLYVLFRCLFLFLFISFSILLFWKISPFAFKLDDLKL